MNTETITPNSLKPFKNSKKPKKRIGRGESSGQGKTSGKGHKGQNSRSGGGTRPGFEGGQTPIYKRLPKLRGFKNMFKEVYAEVNLEKLSNLADGSIVTIDTLKEAGIVNRNAKLLKILGRGDVSVKLTVTADKLSASAEKKILAAGGKVELVNVG